MSTLFLIIIINFRNNIYLQGYIIFKGGISMSIANDKGLILLAIIIFAILIIIQVFLSTRKKLIF